MRTKKLILLFVLLPAFLILSATDAFGGDIKGIIIDQTDKSPMPNASVRILREHDSTFVAGGLSDLNGRFLIKSLKQGKYIVEASYIGYRNGVKRVALRTAQAKADADTLLMAPNSIMLKEAEVVGVRTEVKVMQDTVEYNAGSYKTQPSAVVEDLLKRLPGVEVDSEGKITAQGKEISKILVDGKEFFSDDAQVASKNIPVSIVDKLQVIDRKSDLARLTGVDDGEEETVINLTVKKGMKQGWFGNATAGYGTDNRHSGNLMINRFVNENQFSIVGGANNTNESGFSSPGAGRFSRFGGSNGINTSQNIGINFSIGNTEKFRIGGDIMYSHSNRQTEQLSSKQYLFTDSTSYESSWSKTRNKNHSARGNFRMKWEADSFNTIDFRPNFTVSFNDSEKADSSYLQAGDDRHTAVNRSRNNMLSSGTSYDLQGELIYNHKFSNHPGRSFSTQLSYKFSNTQEDETTYALNEFFLVPENNETRDQKTDNRQWSNRASLRLTWTEPLGDIKKARFLTFAYRMNYHFNNADKLVYNIDDAGFDAEKATRILEHEYGILTNPFAACQIAESTEMLDEDLSNRFRNDQFTQQVRIGFQQNRKDYRLNAGISVNPTMMRSNDLINSERNIPTNWVWNYAPFIRFRYMFSKTSSLAIDYRGNTQSPTMTQLQPIADESDPLRIVIGNPDLLPAFQHHIMLRYNNFNQEKQSSLMAFGGINFSQNSIISKTTFNKETGGQTTTYDNVNGAWSANGMMMYTTPLRNKNWHFSNNVFLRYSRTVGYNNGQLNRSGTFNISETPSIAFRTDAVDIELRPYYNFQLTRNSIQHNSDRNIHSYGANLNANYYTPIGIVLGSDLSYSNTDGYSAGYDNEQWFWNASVAYQFMKQKQATITLKAYDLLHQKQSISRTITANHITDQEYNTITRYFMLSFTYKFTAFGKGTTEQDFNYDGFRPRHRRRPF